MYSQKGEKPVYGSFNSREAIDTVISNSGIKLSQEVPYHIGYPPLLKGSGKEKGTISYSGSRSSTLTNASIPPNNYLAHPSIYCDNKNLISPSNSDRPTSPTKSEKITSSSTKTDNRQSSFSSSGNSIEISSQKRDVTRNISSLNGIDGGTKYAISHGGPTMNGSLDIYSTSIPVESINGKNQYTSNNIFPPLGDSITSNGHTGKTQSNNNRPINGQMNQRNVSTSDETPQIPLSDKSCDQNLTSTLNNTNGNGENGNHNVSPANTVPKDVNTAVDGTQSQQSKGTTNISPSNKPTTAIRWADLLRSNGDVTVTTPTTTQKPVTKPLNSNKQEKPTAPLPNGKPVVGGLAGVLANYEPSFQRVSLPPRGLVNNGNMCFMNAILQTLFYCPPFYNLLARIAKEVVHSFKSKTPLIDSLIMFVNEYKQSKTAETEEVGEHILPDYVYDALRGLKRFDSMKGRQEDAEEFLGFLLDGLHEEFLRVSKPSGTANGQVDSHEKVTSPKDESEEIWMEVGPRNKTSYTRTVFILRIM